MTEIELKFVLDEDGEARLRDHPALRRMTRGRASTKTLRTIYHDTDDWRLRAANIALRVRHADGRWLQTIKLGHTMRGGLAQSREVETELPDGTVDLDTIPDPDVRDELLAALGGKPFRPVAETRIRRTGRTLEHGGSVIEFALDHGEIVAGERSETLREAELELVEGEPAALFDAAARIFDSGLIRFSERSKAARGYMLAEAGRIFDPMKVRKAAKVELEPDLATETALSRLLAECLEQIASNALVVQQSDDSEGAHQLRVGLRRLRSVLRLVPKEHAPPRLIFLAEEARRMGQVTGQLRDLDVMREDLLHAAAASLPAAGLAALDSALAERAEAERARLRKALDEARTQRFLLEISAAAAEGFRRRRSGDLGEELLARPIGKTMGEALDRAWARVEKRARGISRLSVADRHELRKALKVLRYTVEFSLPLYGKATARPFLRQLKALQEVFGDLNDLATAETLLLAEDAPGAEDPQAQLTAGLLLGAARLRAEHGWEGAKVAWKALRSEKRYWRN